MRPDGKEGASTVAQIQVAISAPGNRQKVWRLPNDRLVGLLVPTIVERMGLSAKINWTLIATKKHKALAEDKTLAREKVQPGAVLQLEPVRNTLFKKFLQNLYEEAEGNVQDKLWDKALEKLQELHEYDPRFPDPKGLRKLTGLGITPSAIPAAGVSWGLVLGGVALAGTLAVGAVAVVGGGGYILYRASQHEERYTPPPPEPTELSGDGNRQPHTGDVQITLEWYDPVDLDLHVMDPYGDHVYYNNRQVASGGELDVDANYLCSNIVPSPLENVYWPWGGAPEGSYEVSVVYIDCSNQGAVDYRVIVRVDGDVLDTYSGSISPGEEKIITSFER
jgi:hypothetical protein